MMSATCPAASPLCLALADERDRLRARVADTERREQELRAALREVLAALSNGSGATNEASHEFHLAVPREVRAELRRLVLSTARGAR